tara:strand:- start:4602 stop:5465 length:864 start_codon:yes stop_codon:yes gene_type:complete
MTSTNNQIIEKVPLKDRMTVYIGVLIILVVSWGYIIGMGWHMGTLPFVENPSMQMDMNQSMSMDSKKTSILDTILMWMPPSQGEWMLKDFFLLFLMWSVMMIAMMTPSILPMVMLFTALNINKQRNNQPSASPLILLIGYLISWILFSLVITFPQYAMHKSGLLNPMMEPTHAYLASAVLIIAGIYQFTPFKDACLSVCQSPLSFLMNNWKDGNFGAFLIGYKHGFYCIGCCWFLMMTLFALGVMNILWVVVLTLFVMFEKLSYRFPLLFRYSTGAIFIAWGTILIL